MNIDKFLKREIGSLNKHFPKIRKSLFELLKEDKPSVKDRENNLHMFKKEELRTLKKIVGDEDSKKLKIPIMIRISPGLGRGAALITGNVEKKVINNILEKEEKNKEKLIIYRPEVQKIRRKLPTTTKYAFSISSRGKNIDFSK